MSAMVTTRTHLWPGAPRRGGLPPQSGSWPRTAVVGSIEDSFATTIGASSSRSKVSRTCTTPVGTVPWSDGPDPQVAGFVGHASHLLGGGRYVDR